MADPRLEVSLFLTLRLAYCGEAFALSVPRKGESLLAYLLLNRSVALTRDAVAFALWPDEKEGAARANLRRHIHLLGRALPGGTDDVPWILSGMKTVQWNPEAPVWTDVAAFEQQSQSATPTWEGLQLFTGDLLLELDDEWLTPIRERLRNLFAETILRSARAHRRAGELELAIRELQLLLERDRWREDALRELIATRYRAGDRAGATQEYWKFVTALQAELAVDPMPETSALYEAILQSRDHPALADEIESPLVHRAATRSPSQAPARATHKSAAATSPSMRTVVRSRALVGRESELEFLRERMQDLADERRGHTIVVEGAAGLGKTRLVAEALAAPPFDKAAQAFAACFRYTRSPLAPLSDALGTLAEKSTSVLASRPWLTATDQRMQFSAMCEALRNISASGPVVVAIDDLHWSDDATLECLSFLVPRLQSSAVMFILTFRPEAVDPGHPLAATLGALQRTENVENLFLRPLDDEEIRIMAKDVIGEGRARETFDRITQLAEGNPLFAEELIKHAIEVQGGGESQTLPLTLKAAVLQRFDEFDDEGRSLLTQAAVLGRDFSMPLLCSVAGSTSASASVILRKARDAQLIVETGGGPYSFRHALLREILYGELLQDEARALHRRAGEAFEAFGEPEKHAVELATHWTRANDSDRAVRYNDLAGDMSMRVFAHRDAIRHYERAAEFAGADDSRLALLSEKIADALTRAGDFAGARKFLGDALAYHESQASSERTAGLCLKMSFVASAALDPRAAVDWAQRAMERSETDRQEPILCAALVRLGRAAIMRADPAAALEYLERAATVESPSTAADLRLGRLTYHGLANGMLGRAARALNDFSTGVSLLREVSDPAGAHAFHQNYAAVAAWLGKTSLALQQLDAAAENARRAFNPVFEAGAFASSALVHSYAGSSLTARAMLDSAMRLAGNSSTLVQVQIVGAGILTALRLEDEVLLADLAAKNVLDAALQSGDATFTAVITGAYIEYFASLEDIERLRALVHQLAMNAGCGANLVGAVVEIGRYAGDDDLEKVGIALEGWASLGSNEAGEAFLALFRAIIAARTGKRSARREAQVAYELLQRLEFPYYHAIALELAGEYARAITIHERMHNRRDAQRVAKIAQASKRRSTRTLPATAG